MMVNLIKTSNSGKFSKSSIPDKIKAEMIAKKIWSSNCPVALDRLQLLNLSYVDYDNKDHHNGQMIVFDVIADSVLTIFHTLYQKRFPLFDIRLINDFNGDDGLSLQANNSSCFNCRKILNTNKYSIHSYGMAIDINPVQNPYLFTAPEGKSIEILPTEGMKYINRTKVKFGMAESQIDDSTGLTVIELFKMHGLSNWGGDWDFPDWQHFQVPTEEAKTLATLSFDEGYKYFNSIKNKAKIK